MSSAVRVRENPFDFCRSLIEGPEKVVEKEGPTLEDEDVQKLLEEQDYVSLIKAAYRSDARARFTFFNEQSRDGRHPIFLYPLMYEVVNDELSTLVEDTWRFRFEHHVYPRLFVAKVRLMQDWACCKIPKVEEIVERFHATWTNYIVLKAFERDVTLLTFSELGKDAWQRIADLAGLILFSQRHSAPTWLANCATSQDEVLQCMQISKRQWQKIRVDQGVKEFGYFNQQIELPENHLD